MKKGPKTLAGLIVLVLLGYFMPFITVTETDDEGKKWIVPFASSFLEKDDETAVFTSPRSSYALRKDAQNAIHSYEEQKCYGTVYYYDSEKDISYERVEVVSGMPGRVIFHFRQGNVCEGWSVDDEIAWEDGDPLKIDPSINPQQAMENGWIVVQDGKLLNVAQYFDFSRMVKQGVLCMQRVLIYEADSLTVLDIQLMEDASFRLIRVEDGVSATERYGRFTEVETENGLYAALYRGMNQEEEPTVLFPCR